MAVPYTEYPIDVVRSARRRKSSVAQVVDGRIRVVVPARMSQAEVDAHVEYLVGRLEKARRRHHDVDLERLTAELCRTYDLPRPTSVRWVTNQRKRWGSCTPATGEIRLSHRLRPWPRFVLEYVLLHELAHLVEPNHSARFHAIVARHPKAERAEGFLLAQAWRTSPADDAAPGDGGGQAAHDEHEDHEAHEAHEAPDVGIGGPGFEDGDPFEGCAALDVDQVGGDEGGHGAGSAPSVLASVEPPEPQAGPAPRARRGRGSAPSGPAGQGPWEARPLFELG